MLDSLVTVVVLSLLLVLWCFMKADNDEKHARSEKMCGGRVNGVGVVLNLKVGWVWTNKLIYESLRKSPKFQIGLIKAQFGFLQVIIFFTSKPIKFGSPSCLFHVYITLHNMFFFRETIFLTFLDLVLMFHLQNLASFFF